MEGGRFSSLAVDAVDLEVVKASLAGIVQEMQNSLFRTGFSTIIRESQDASCALMNSPVTSISNACLRKTFRESATPGVEQKRPTFTPLTANRAALDATARSHMATN